MSSLFDYPCLNESAHGQYKGTHRVPFLAALLTIFEAVFENILLTGGRVSDDDAIRDFIKIKLWMTRWSVCVVSFYLLMNLESERSL